MECRRINGKPRPIVLADLGKAENLLRHLQQLDRPYTALIRDFGAVAALWEIAQDLGLHALLQQHSPKRRQGHAVADYLLLTALNRALRPGPKTRLAEWYKGTILPCLLPIPAKQLSSQRFWDHFDYLDADTLRRIEERPRPPPGPGEPPRPQTSLVYDATNFDTSIDSQTAARLPQRTCQEPQPANLRIIGLGKRSSRNVSITVGKSAGQLVGLGHADRFARHP